MPQVHEGIGAAAVREAVYDYVEKGAFRQLKERAGTREGSTEFRFSWLSENDRMVLEVDEARRALVFRGLLPAMPERVRTFVAAFVAERGAEGAAPAHRRVDASLGELFLEETDEGRTSFGVVLNDDARWLEGARKLVNLANEMIYSLQMRHADYVYEGFAKIDE